MSNKWLKKAAFFALLLGTIVALEQNFQVLRLRNVTIPTLEVLPDSILWPRVSSENIRYWPLFYLDKDKVIKDIEENIPVTVTIECTGWGSFSFMARPLKPKFMVFWRGSEWFVADGGLMWSVYHPMNGVIQAQKPEENMIVIWSDALGRDSVKHEMAPEEIISSPIPLSKLEYWKKLLEDSGFYENTKSISVFPEGEEIYVEVLMRLGSQRVKVKLQASGENWRLLFKAIKNILKDPEISGYDVFIDTTYEGKILVKKERKSTGVW